MKKNNVHDLKKMDTADLQKQLQQAQSEMGNLIIAKNTAKLSDLKAVSKKKRDIAQMATVLNQKLMLERLEKVNA